MRNNRGGYRNEMENDYKDRSWSTERTVRVGGGGGKEWKSKGVEFLFFFFFFFKDR